MKTEEKTDSGSSSLRRQAAPFSLQETGRFFAQGVCTTQSKETNMPMHEVITDGSYRSCCRPRVGAGAGREPSSAAWSLGGVRKAPDANSATATASASCSPALTG